ncbi:MAG: DEAD/DEAH box helicase [Vampirovibrionia bacterium]
MILSQKLREGNLMISVYISNDISVNKNMIGYKCLEYIKNMLTFKDPNNKQNLYCFYKIDDDNIQIPRGSILGVKRVLKENNKKVKWISKVTSKKLDNTPTIDDLNISLRPYQIECVQKMIDRVQGIVQMPCGAGKTTTATVAMLMCGESSLVLTHTREILEQWVQTIERIGGKKVRVISSENKKISLLPLKKGEIAVGMIQTITSKIRSSDSLNMKSFLKSAGCIITDEAHHVPADQWKAIVDYVPARYRWGLTATPDRSDGLGFMLNVFIGPLLYKVSTKFLIESRYLQSPTIVPVSTGYTPSKTDYGYIKGNRNTLNYTKAVSSICKDKDRNRIIRELIISAYKKKRQTLVLVSRKSNASTIYKMLSKVGIKSCVMTSDVSSENRDLALKLFRRGSVKVIIATQLADEGLDVPNIDCIVAASPAKHHGRVLQRVGRALRLGGSDPVIFDLVDEQEFRYQFNHRRRSYMKEYGNVVLSEHNVKDAIFYMDMISK